MELQTIEIVTLTNSGISIIMGLYMLFLYRTTAANGTAYWAFGSLLIGVGLLLRLTPPADQYISMVGPGVFVSIGLYLYLAGIWEFKERKIHTWVIVGFPLLDFIQSLVFFFIFHSFRTQVILHVLFLIIYSILAIYEMFKLTPSQNYLKTIFQINAISFVVFLLMLLLNVIAVFSQNNYSPSSLSETGVVLHIISGFVMIALTFGFLMAANMKLDRELRGQLKSKTKFFSIIAHDLRSPVANIIGVLELLNNESDFTEHERRKFMATLTLLSNSTFHLLQNLLEWASKSKNLNQYENENLDLNTIVADNIDFFKSSAALKSIQIDFFAGEQMQIVGNKNMLATIIRNIVSNAIKFTPVKGNITLCTIKSDTKVCITITDTGKGIKPETLSTLLNFEENYSTKGTEGEVGAGLGLVLCNEFVAQNGGTLHFDSQLNKGTTVTVEFPCVN